MKSRLSHMVVMACLALSGMGVHAASEWTWVLNGSPTGADLPVSATVGGFFAPDNSTALVTKSPYWYSGGYGICSPTPTDPNCTSPNHAIDNNSGYESVLLSFGSNVTLTSLNIGWRDTDSDMSVLAYTGGGTPTLSGATYSGLLGSGWSLVGQYSNVPTSTSVSSPSLNLGSSFSSSYWLVAAYNSTFQDKGWTLGNDYVKLYAVAGNTNNPPGKVSEPAALLLMGTALFGIVGLQRRRYTEC